MKRAVLSFLLLVVVGCADPGTADDDGPPPLTGDLYSLKYGPITVQPTTWVVQDGRIRELADPDAIADTVGAGAAVVIVGRA